MTQATVTTEEVRGPGQVTLPLSADQMDAIEEMMKREGQSKTELCRRALVLLGKEVGVPFPVRLRIL